METKNITKKLNKNTTNCVVISGKLGSRMYYKGTKVYTNLLCKNLSIPIVCSKNANVETYIGRNIVLKGRIGKTYEYISENQKYKSKLAIYAEYMEVINDL